MIKSTQILFLMFFSFTLNAQVVSNVHFEQVGKQIHIFYDLEGSDTYTVQVFCSTNNGQSWGDPLKHVTGAVGENQIPGKGKKIVWDVLTEKEKLSGEIQFQIKISTEAKIGSFYNKRDWQVYKWVKIGSQTWMAENLNYQTTNSWWYDNSSANGDVYGRLYTWEAATAACPTGWHLPTDDEWKSLEIYMGMSQSQADATEYRGTEEGKKLKRTSGWNSDGNGTNAVGFSALPGGLRLTNGVFSYLGYFGNWWSATADSSTTAWDRVLPYVTGEVGRFNTLSKGYGYSVRCVRD